MFLHGIISACVLSVASQSTMHSPNVCASLYFFFPLFFSLQGGELFERIVGRPRFTEVEAAKLIRPLLESVAYLHDLGKFRVLWSE